MTGWDLILQDRARRLYQFHQGNTIYWWNSTLASQQEGPRLESQLDQGHFCVELAWSFTVCWSFPVSSHISKTYIFSLSSWLTFTPSHSSKPSHRWPRCGRRSPLLCLRARSNFRCSSLTKWRPVWWKCWNAPGSSFTAAPRGAAGCFTLRSFWICPGRSSTRAPGAMWTKNGGASTRTAACSKRQPCAARIRPPTTSCRLWRPSTWLCWWAQPSWRISFRF